MIAQNAQLNDPYVREIDSALDAVKNRIPFARETLPAQRDAFGEQIKNRERLAVVSPIVTNTVTDDPVRLEAARLKIGIAKAPKEIHIGKNTGKIGDVKLTPEERDIFASESGQYAHRMMSQLMESPAWSKQPDIVKERIFKRVFDASRNIAAFKAIAPEKRQELTRDIVTKFQNKLHEIPED